MESQILVKTGCTGALEHKRSGVGSEVYGIQSWDITNHGGFMYPNGYVPTYKGDSMVTVLTPGF
jgi:hypothetical protein